MEQYRYSLEKGSRKYICPNCQKKKFVRYINTATGDYIPEQYGRCDSEVNCGYHLNPHTDGYAQVIWKQEQGGYSENWKPPRPQIKPQIKQREPVFIPVEVLEQTLKGYEHNTFLQNLTSNIPFPFDPEDVERVAGLYYLGTVSRGYRAGAITFPFIDSNRNVRAIQVKQFDKGNHTTGTDFIHSIIERHCREKETVLPDWLTTYQQNDLKVSCMFGAHLLGKYSLNPIALVEAPKTAIYGSLYFGLPDNPKNFLWLAVYNLSSINYAKCKELQDREVYLFPDLSKDGKAFDLWSRKAQELSLLMKGTIFTVSDLLERNATKKERESGKDLADYLIELDWREFRYNNEKYENNEGLETAYFSTSIVSTCSKSKFLESVIERDEKPDATVEDKRHELLTVPPKFNHAEFKQWFDIITMPESPMLLDGGIIVYNALAFVKGRLNHIKAFENYREQGNRSLFINQLQQFRKQLTS